MLSNKEPAMRTAFQGLTTREIEQVRMYGCTEAQMREEIGRAHV